MNNKIKIIIILMDQNNYYKLNNINSYLKYINNYKDNHKNKYNFLKYFN